MLMIEIHGITGAKAKEMREHLFSICPPSLQRKLIINVVPTDNESREQRSVPFFRCFTPDPRTFDELKQRIELLRGKFEVPRNMFIQNIQTSHV